MSDHSPQLCTLAFFPHEINEEWGLNLLVAHLLCKDEHFPLEKKAHQKKYTDYYNVSNLIEKSPQKKIQIAIMC